MSRNYYSEDRQSAPGEAAVVGRIVGITDEATHAGPLPAESSPEQLMTFHGHQVEHVPVSRVLCGMGCTTSVLVAPRVQHV